ncbi:LamG domain-containing protein [Streptomyces thermolilacinus]|uniref:LamG domain-containing protein n=1 Tax=Streptomyces thermolilacinus TaxID=285540 RepID=UPI0033FD3E43
MNIVGSRPYRAARGRLVVGGLVTAALLGVPGTAHAATDLPPHQPLVQDLRTGTGPCAAGDERTYVDSAPRLSAVLHDPADDAPGTGNWVTGEFETWWTDAAGAEQRRTHTTYRALSGDAVTWQLPEEVPADTVVSWRVRAHDGTAASDWSDAGTGSVCEFVRDDVSPEKPAVASADSPDEQYRGSVGVYARFTVDSPSDDVVAYRYDFIGGPSLTVRPAVPGGPVTITHLPLSAGPNRLSVSAFDRAWRVSPTATYEFTVDEGRAPVAHWTLSDAPGSATATAQAGPAAHAGSGVTFGADAPRGTSLTSTASLDGSSHDYLTPNTPVLDLGKSFAVSSWARPARTDLNMTVAAQDAGTDAGFTLGLRTRDEGPHWSFAVGGARVTGGAPKTGAWAHLLGVYDAETGHARLYVNGHEVGTATKAAPSATTGAFQIGRARNGDGYRDRWHGEIGDVRAHDRVVVPAEATQLAYRKATVLGRWALETATDGVSPAQNGGKPLTLGPGATIHRGPDYSSCFPGIDPDCPDVPNALVGDGHLQLDGTTGYATTGTTLVDTTESFTVGVVVRIGDAQPDRPMTVLSQAGRYTDIFKVRYDPAAFAWQLVMPQRDEPGAPETVVSQIAAPRGDSDQGNRLAVVRDAATGQIKLYLNGQTGAGATASLPDGLPSTGALQIGRAKTGDGWGEYLRGDVDEVQVYAGALRDRDIQALGTGTDPCLC